MFSWMWVRGFGVELVVGPEDGESLPPWRLRCPRGTIPATGWSWCQTC